MTGRPIPDSDIRSTLVEANDSIWWPRLSPDGSKIAYQDGGSIYVVDLFTRESSKVADGDNAEWLDNDTLIVAP
jgi:Tol biopolymer transport system component